MSTKEDGYVNSINGISYAKLLYNLIFLMV